MTALVLQNESFIVEKLNYFPWVFYYFDVSTFLLEILHCIYIYFKIFLAVFMLGAYMIWVFLNNLVFFFEEFQSFSCQQRIHFVFLRINIRVRKLIWFINSQMLFFILLFYWSGLSHCFSAKWNFQTFFRACAENSSSNWTIALTFSALFNCPIRKKMTYILID